MDNTTKPSSRLSLEELSSDGQYLPEDERGTDKDMQDMTRIGKKQVLRVSQALLVKDETNN